MYIKYHIIIRKYIEVLADLLHLKTFLTGFILILSLVILSAVGFFIIDYKYTYAGAFEPEKPPNGTNILGTDVLGRDIFAQIIYAIPSSLAVGMIAGAIGTIIGSLVGFIAGYYRGNLDNILRLLIDVFLSLPSLLVLVLIASYYRGTDYITMALIISMFNWAWPARQVRAQVLSLRERDFVMLAKLSNMSNYEIIARELMPHMMPWMFANFINATISAILTESSLSIIGLGPQRSITLGMVLYWSLSYASIYRGIWWWWVPPVILLGIIFLSLYMIYMGITKYFSEREVII